MADDHLASRFEALLVGAGGTPRNVQLFMQVRGLASGAPQSLRHAAGGLTAERVRQILLGIEQRVVSVVRLDSGPNATQLRTDLAEELRRIESLVPGTEEEIWELLQRGVEATRTSPASVLRMADTLGVQHNLRITKWVARSKFMASDRTRLAASAMDAHRDALWAIVPATMPEVFENFLNFARKISRGAGAVGAGALSAWYAKQTGIALTPHEATAFLKPFAVHLGRHEGDDWFAFMSSANDFLRKTKERVDVFGTASFSGVLDYHLRFNRSLYMSGQVQLSASALKALLLLAGFQLQGDDITLMVPIRGHQGSRLSEIQMRMVEAFRTELARTPGRTSMRRADAIRVMREAGIRDSTITIYLRNKGLFVCKRGICQLADRQRSTVTAPLNVLEQKLLKGAPEPPPGFIAY